MNDNQTHDSFHKLLTKVLKFQNECVQQNFELCDIDTDNEKHNVLLLNAIFGKLSQEIVEFENEIKNIQVFKTKVSNDANMHKVIDELMDLLNYSLNIYATTFMSLPVNKVPELGRVPDSNTITKAIDKSEELFNSLEYTNSKVSHNNILKSLVFKQTEEFKANNHKLFNNSPVNWHRRDKKTSIENINESIQSMIFNFIYLVFIFSELYDVTTASILDICFDKIEKVKQHNVIK